MSRPTITIDPRRRFGKPCIDGINEIEWLAGNYWNGWSLEEIDGDWGVTRDDLFHACWYAARYGGYSQWTSWLRTVESRWTELMWPEDPPGQLPLPPQRTWPRVKRPRRTRLAQT